MERFGDRYSNQYSHRIVVQGYQAKWHCIAQYNRLIYQTSKQPIGRAVQRYTERQTPKAEFARFDRRYQSGIIGESDSQSRIYKSPASATRCNIHAFDALVLPFFPVSSSVRSSITLHVFHCFSTTSAWPAEHVLRTLYSFTRHPGHFSRAPNVFFRFIPTGIGVVGFDTSEYLSFFFLNLHICMSWCQKKKQIKSARINQKCTLHCCHGREHCTVRENLTEDGSLSCQNQAWLYIE